MKDFAHKCLRTVLTYQPNPLRPDCITVGFVLSDTVQQRVAVRFLSDFNILTRIAPDADIEAFEAALLTSEHELVSILGNVTDASKHSALLPETLPFELNVLPSTAVLTDNFEDELSIQASHLLSVPKFEGDPKPNRSRHGRLYLRREIRSTFVSYGVWDHLDKGISVERFTLEGDPYTIDCGYLDKSANTYRMFDAVSLVTSLDRAKTLALTWPSIRDGLQHEKNAACEMFAIVENDVENLEESKLGWDWMKDAGIHVNPVVTMNALAAQARTALRL